MYVMQNTLKNLGRNKGKNILLGIIVFSRIVTTVVTMAISRATSAVIAEYKQQFDSEVSFKMNPTKASSAMEYRSMGNEELLTLGQSDTLQKTQWTAIVCGKPEGLKALDEDTENGYSISGPIGESGEPSTGEITVIVYASDRSDIGDDFKTGIREIVDGRVYEKAGECIVSQPFAELNSLSVGDKFTVNDDTGIPCELTVSGIFRDDSMTGDNTPTIYNFVQMPTTNRYNEILTGFNTYTDTAWRNSKSSNTDVMPVYYLKSPDLLDRFNKEAHDLGIPDYYEAQTDTLSYNRIVGPVEGLAGVAKTFLIIVLALGSALLILVSILAMRERKYEIGVLRAMGMKKSQSRSRACCRNAGFDCALPCVGLWRRLCGSATDCQRTAAKTGGSILYAGADLSQTDRDTYRAQDIGVVFQGYNLLLNAMALEILCFPCTSAKARKRIKRLLR